MPFVMDQGKEALNFNISVLIYGVICIPFMLILIGYLFLAIIGVFWIMMTIVALVKANSGIKYRYPLTMRLVR